MIAFWGSAGEQITLADMFGEKNPDFWKEKGLFLGLSFAKLQVNDHFGKSWELFIFSS